MAAPLRILLFTEGNLNHASTRIRAVKPMEFWENTQIIFCPRSPLRSRKGLLNKLFFALEKRMLLFRRKRVLFSGNYDLVFSQRTCLTEKELSFLKKNQKPLLFDFDDAIHLLSHRKNAAIDTARMVKEANRIVVSTEELADYCSSLGKKAEVLVSSIDTDIIRPSIRRNNRFVVGWTGSPATTIYLDEIKDTIAQFCTLPNVEFTTFGAAPRTWMSELKIVNHPWTEQGELQFLQTLDAGIMPLTNDEWSRGKGGYKLYLYMASGIPCVASPVGINARIVIDGVNGFLADTPEEWLARIKSLSENTDLSQQLGRTGRQHAEEKYAMKLAAKTLKNWVDELTRK